MRFVCESCRAQYMINDEKVGPKGVKVRCRKCGYVILVKRADAAKAGGPIAQSNDPDDALATQVMQTPLAAAEATLSNEDGATGGEDLTNPGGGGSPAATADGGGPKDSFFGADEDEIGAVFDQVLKGNTGSTPAYKPADGGGSPDDRQSTRVIDADTVRKLAEESGVVEKPAAAAAPETKPEEVPTTDWYVAINEKQTGPLTLEKVKEHWDRGEISPDSLCWRAGFDDWIPVSEVKMLSGVLAPKPPKPIVVAPAATITHSGVAAVMSVPVQSAFSAGGMVQTVQSEMQVPVSASAASASPGEESVGWKPSAASALASLVKDEMDALAKPPPKAPPPPADDAPRGGGLLDLPHDEKPAAAAPVEDAAPARPARPAPPPPNPYLANPGATYSAPAVTQYRPPSNKNVMIIAAAVGGVVLLTLFGLVIWLATRPPPQVVVAPTPVAVVQPAPTPVPAPTPAPVAAPAPVAVAAVTPTPAPTPAPTEAAQPAANPTAAPAPTPAPAPVAAAPAAPVQPKSTTTRTQTKTSPRVERDPDPEPVKKSAPSSSSGDGDDFDKAFGGSSSKTAAKEEPKSEKKPAGYIPPAPGGAAADVKESLGPSDIMEVVLANKGALGKCVEEQRKKDPGSSGKLLMRWTIQTNGRTSNVGVASEEHKGTPIAGCVGALIKGMSFPKHKKQGEPITFPFKF